MTIEDIKIAVKEVADKYPISHVLLFGSRADGTSTPESDVDLIMEFSSPITLITLSQIKQELEEILLTKVDLVHGPIRKSDMIEIGKVEEIFSLQKT